MPEAGAPAPSYAFTRLLCFLQEIAGNLARHISGNISDIAEDIWLEVQRKRRRVDIPSPTAELMVS